MTVLLAKSLDNIRAAELLMIQHSFYATSVHCSYYSAFQRSAHILRDKFKLTDKDIDLGAAFGNVGGDSHKKLISVMYEKLDKAGEKLKAIDFRRDMGKLKSKRTKADYSDEPIDKPFSEEAYKQAQAINQLLEHVFPLS